MRCSDTDLVKMAFLCEFCVAKWIKDDDISWKKGIMDNGAIYHYIENYFHQCLGVGEILRPLESPRIVLDENPPAPTQHHLLWEKGALELVASQQGESKFFVLFVRVPWTPLTSSVEREESKSMSKVPISFCSLEEDLKSRELFNKLRQAMKLDSTSAPYVEILDSDVKSVLIDLHSLATHIFVMYGDGTEDISSLWSNINTFIDSPVDTQKSVTFWTLPDPAELFRQPQLKRPTWDWLRWWMDEYL